MIKINDTPRHMHIFCVALENSPINKVDIVNLYLYFIFYKYI